MLSNKVFLTECPRDAMQGIHDFIPTELKVDYLNALLSCGFNRLDFGSFVSPKAIPQLRDSAEVLPHLNVDGNTKLLAIVANERGVEAALDFKQIDFLGFPFSISEQFQMRNTNSTISEAKKNLRSMVELIHQEKRELMLYLSMGFGNPYGEPWSPNLVVDHAKSLYETLGIRHFALSDTIGCAEPAMVFELFTTLSNALTEVEISAHLHVLPEKSTDIFDAAYRAGCRNFDAALMGIGGCPMATNALTGNMATESVLRFAAAKEVETGINEEAFEVAMAIAAKIFNQYH